MKLTCFLSGWSRITLTRPYRLPRTPPQPLPLANPLLLGRLGLLSSTLLGHLTYHPHVEQPSNLRKKSNHHFNTFIYIYIWYIQHP